MASNQCSFRESEGRRTRRLPTRGCFVRMMERAKREVLLIVDNFSGHEVTVKLKAVTIKFLPANVTPLIHPLDMVRPQASRRSETLVGRQVLMLSLL